MNSYLSCATSFGVFSLVVALAATTVDATTRPSEYGGTAFQLHHASNGIASLKRQGDASGIDFIRKDAVLGPVKVRIRDAQAKDSSASWREVAHDGDAVTVSSQFRPDGENLLWEIVVTNGGDTAIEVGDVEIPLPMNTSYSRDAEETFVRRVFQHSFVAGCGSFLYWLPVKGTGSFLVMLPVDGTALEFFDGKNANYSSGEGNFSVFALAKAAAESKTHGDWRQERTSRRLLPKQDARFTFLLCWADDYQGVRGALFQHGGVDVYVAPGMVIPQDLGARIALRTKRQIDRVEAEHPLDTKVDHSASPTSGILIYKLKFGRLGENRILVHFRDGGTMPLEFFVTQPLEMLIKKRARFIVENQQHRDPAKWYNRLFSLWDQRRSAGENLLGPDNLGGQHPYAVSGSDDPCNGKCLLVAEKNVAFPDAEEIQALEAFAADFVWGKHQRTDAEYPYPFGIYGSDSWQENRFTSRDSLEEGVSRPGGPSACRMWRSYDYTTYFALYFNLYRIARHHPELVHYLDADGYLERAYGTALAYFQVPANIRMDGGWTHSGWVYWQYTTGNFHEKYLLPLIAALEAEGKQEKADTLRREWEKKVKYFVYDDPWPFASEMTVDSTAYESTYAAADYALRHGLTPDSDLWYDRNHNRSYSHPSISASKHQDFLHRQHAANLACRGVLETHYWLLGSDFRGSGSATYTLSYMSQMGGWSVLDYALHHDPNPAESLRLGIASLLSSWALMNAGDSASNYGYWTPSKQHDGSVGWGFQPRQSGREWNAAMEDLPRGAWPVCGEIDHGLVAGIEAARTVLFDDPVFGLIALCGELKTDGDTFAVTPRDGVRQRFSAIIGDHRFHLELDQDGFASEQPIVVHRDLKSIKFALENRGGAPHDSRITVCGLTPGEYTVKSATSTKVIVVPASRKATFEVPVASSENPFVIHPIE